MSPGAKKKKPPKPAKERQGRGKMACFFGGGSISRLSLLKSYSPPGLGRRHRGERRLPGICWEGQSCHETLRYAKLRASGKTILMGFAAEHPWFNCVAPRSEGAHGWRSYWDLCCGCP